MKLYEYLGEDEFGEEKRRVVAESEDIEELQELALKLWRQRSDKNASWLGSTKSWQGLYSEGKPLPFYIRPA